MADFFDELNQKHKDFISQQSFFTVATAPKKGRINISPKGMDTFRILDNNTVIYLDFIGSANETAAHLKDDGRITIMFMSFTRNAQILRLYGQGKAIQKNTDQFSKLIELFELTDGVRQIIIIELNSVATSCGYGVPIMESPVERETLGKWISSKTAEEQKEYQKDKNLTSIDGLNTGLQLDN